MSYKIENNKVTFDCSCSFNIIGDSLFPKSTLPSIKFDPDIDVNLNCEYTWKIISQGLTKGMFQIETPLGKQWSKKMKPTHIEHMSALISIVRPGCLECIDKDGISMTAHYCRRKNGEEEVTYFHPSLISSLESTYGILCYQEQSMKICQELAGFNEQEADTVRKSLGKKLPEEVAKVKIKFLEGCKKINKVSEQEAIDIFSFIEKGQRYIFNRSHAMSYALITYQTAFAKAHFPLQMYTSCLKSAQNDAHPYDEIKDLVVDAKKMDIKVLPPDILNLNNNFYTDGEDIFFGISDIKGIGESFLTKLQTLLKEKNLELKNLTWFDLLLDVLDNFSTTIVHRLIETGALRYYGVARQRMIAEYDIYHDKLGDKTEKAWILEHRSEFTNLLDTLKSVSKTRKEGGGCASVKSVAKMKDLIHSLENHPISWEDNIDEISICEQKYLGIRLTHNELEKYDIDRATYTCKDILDGYMGFAVLAVKLDRVSKVKIKKGNDKGKEMTFLTVSDSSSQLESVVAFAEITENYSYLLVEDNLVFLSGRMNRSNSFQVEGIYQIV